MATYAYRDVTRKSIIYASNAVEEDREKIFFCPNYYCNAHLHICAVDGSNKAYFRATQKQFPHVANCPFSSSTNEFDENAFDEDAFLFEDAMIKLFSMTEKQKASKTPNEHGTGKVEKHPPRTIKQIYLMCKSRPVTDTYGDKEISEMILDDRSIYRYPKGCFGYKIVEACIVGKFYDNDKKQILLTAPIKSKKYSFILQFNDKDIYRLVRNEFYNNQSKIFAIAGNWIKGSVYNCFVSDVNSRKQVAVVK